VELGGTDDATLVSAAYKDWASTVRFRRKLDTGDQWDYKLTKGPTDLVYAWCLEPFCVSRQTAHAPGDWAIMHVDLSETQSAQVAKGHEALKLLGQSGNQSVSML
jgi:hypothetical protein